MVIFRILPSERNRVLDRRAANGIRGGFLVHLLPQSSLPACLMPPTHPAGPLYDSADVFCDAAVVRCRALRRDPSFSPTARSIARAIQHHALADFLKARAEVAVDPSLAKAVRFAQVGSDWVGIVPHIARILASADDCQHGQAPTPAAKILTALVTETHLAPPNSSAARVLGALWSETAAPYLLHLSSWLEHGTVHDASGDFFIHRDVDAVVEAGKPPGHAFIVDHSRLPDFVTAESAHRIFFAGNVVNCIKRFGVSADTEAGLPGRGLTPQPEALPMAVRPDAVEYALRMPADADLVRRMMERDGAANVDLAMEAASRVWREASAARLSRLLPFSSLAPYLCALREYLLLGNGLFWSVFFAKFRDFSVCLHSGMTQAEVEAAERGLEYVIQSSLADVESPLGAPCVLQMAVSDDGAVVPCFELPFPVSAVVADCVERYQMTSAVAFGTRRVVLELEHCYSLLAAALRSNGSGSLKSVGGRARPLKSRTRTILKRCLMLRMRQSRFMQAFDDYLQVDVYESGFKPLLALTQKRVAPDSKSKGTEFDDIRAAHLQAVAGWVSQSLASSPSVKARLDAICGTCMELCEIVRRLLDDPGQGDDWRLDGLEASFKQNARLFVLLVGGGGMQNKMGNARVASLLWRCDWDGELSREVSYS